MNAFPNYQLNRKKRRMSRDFFGELYTRVAATRPFRGKTRLLSFILPYTTYIRCVYGPYMRVRVGDITNSFALFGTYGFDLVELIRTLPDDGLFIDIGANQGVFTQCAGMHLRNGTVIALEPNPDIFAELIGNTRLNGLSNVIPLNVGLSTQTALSLLAYSENHSGGAHRLDPDQRTGNPAARTVLLVEPSLLGALVDGLSFDRCLCKIDVEGMEVEILHALRDAGLDQRIDDFFIEINREALAREKTSPEVLYALMREMGFAATGEIREADWYDERFVRNGLPATAVSRGARGAVEEPAASTPA